jgi:hypothetical protein
MAGGWGDGWSNLEPGPRRKKKLQKEAGKDNLIKFILAAVDQKGHLKSLPK